jgi:hypothetical protein
MTTRVDYTQIAAKLDYAALEQKLEQLRKRSPAKKRKRVGDVLAPVQPKLRELHARGWTYELLAHELNAAGVPVKPSTLREYLAAPKPKRDRSSRKAAVT